MAGSPGQFRYCERDSESMTRRTFIQELKQRGFHHEAWTQTWRRDGQDLGWRRIRTAEGNWSRLLAEIDAERFRRPDLKDIYQECRESNWDGDGAFPVTLEVIEQVEKMLAVMQGAEPELSPEPDGCISACWRSSNRDIISISVCDYGLQCFALHVGQQRKASWL